jgi:hypothetical protein
MSADNLTTSEPGEGLQGEGLQTLDAVPEVLRGGGGRLGGVGSFFISPAGPASKNSTRTLANSEKSPPEHAGHSAARAVDVHAASRSSAAPESLPPASPHAALWSSHAANSIPDNLAAIFESNRIAPDPFTFALVEEAGC